jgi:uncharacterized protein
MHVETISIAPVKGLALRHPEEVLLERFGVRENRRFHLVDANQLLVNGKRLGTLVQVASEYDDAAGTLALRFPGGEEVGGEIELGDPITTVFYGRPAEGRLVTGAFSEALSGFAGEPLRLVCTDEPGGANDRGTSAGASVVSTGSLAALTRESGAGQPIDQRRFRMLFVVDASEHEEDSWLARDVRIGEALVVPLGNVGRCVITTHDPSTGIRELDTLAALQSYRGAIPTTEPVPFGIWAEVVEPGVVRVGDPVTVE